MHPTVSPDLIAETGQLQSGSHTLKRKLKCWERCAEEINFKRL